MVITGETSLNNCKHKLFLIDLAIKYMNIFDD